MLSDREPRLGLQGSSRTQIDGNGRVLGVAALEDALVATDRTRRTVAQMLAMIRAVVPAMSISADPLNPDGSHGGPSVVFRAMPLRVPPQQLRREYLVRYEGEDPFHASLVVGTNETMRGTFQHPGLERSSNPFMEYAREMGLPQFVRVYLRMDRELVGYLWLARAPSQRPFSERELAFLRAAHPFLQSSYTAVVRPAPRVEDETVLLNRGLTRREADVARYAATGMPAREIAELLVLTEATVRTHLARVYRKLEVRGKAELAARLRPQTA